jgi:hypothetical protein
MLVGLDMAFRQINRQKVAVQHKPEQPLIGKAQKFVSFNSF